ncbi:serine/threonine-protein kinase STK11-like [Ruditapes philippinarum]|uniref:serine/threonine-protein kinase STK11-like n=1 Tax=Ruditapes philippinarum TaxID=129788 RepID=UPI00295B937C|nr:serine/threonine-protein kinase STK11-like [Ruditapes philippinarum]
MQPYIGHDGEAFGHAGLQGVDELSFMNDDDMDLNFFHRVDSAQVVYERRKRAKLVEKYLIGDLLGEGSYGKVKEVLDTETLCRRAVKILKKKRLRRIPNGEINVKRCEYIETSFIKISSQKVCRYMIMEYCADELQSMLESAPEKKFPIWQSHLYNMTTGLYPYEGENIYKLFENIGKGDYVIPDSLDKMLSSLLKEMLQYDASNRISIGEIKQHDWYRKKFPQTSEIVPFPVHPEGYDDLRSMTVIPYVEDMHRGTPSEEDDEELEYEEDHIGQTPVSPVEGNGNTQVNSHSKVEHVEDAIPDSKHKKRKNKSNARRFKFSGCSQS